MNIDYSIAVKNGIALLQQIEESERMADDAGWELCRLVYDVCETGVPAKQFAQDIGVSEAHVSTLRTVWRRYAGERVTMRYRDAYSFAGSSEQTAEVLQAEAKRTGLSVGAVRSKLSRGGVDLPSQRTVHQDTLLSRMVNARRNVLTVLDAIRQGPGPRQKPPSDSDLEAIANIAEEIRDAAEQLTHALGSSVSLVG